MNPPVTLNLIDERFRCAILPDRAAIPGEPRNTRRFRGGLQNDDSVATREPNGCSLRGDADRDDRMNPRTTYARVDRLRAPWPTPPKSIITAITSHIRLIPAIAIRLFTSQAYTIVVTGRKIKPNRGTSNPP